MNGLLIIDKPTGMTSHDVVARVRRVCQERSIGHLGTLDPMATGVLPLALGNMTRLAQFYGNTSKGYIGTIRFGAETDTYDADGEVVEQEVSRDVADVMIEELRSEAAKFVGRIKQTPPPFSAKKLQGVPAYKLARKNQDVDLKAVEVEVLRFDILDYNEGLASFESEVSSGTYIRSLAHELGQNLRTGAHLASLRRTKVGEFEIGEAVTMDELERKAQAGDAESAMIHPRRVLSFMPAVTANEEQVAFVRNGRTVNLPELSSAELIRVYASQRELVAVCRRIAGTLFQPKVVLA